MKPIYTVLTLGQEFYQPHDVYHGNKKIVRLSTLAQAENVAQALNDAHEQGAAEQKAKYDALNNFKVDLSINGYTPPRYLPPYPTEWLEKMK